MSILYLIIIYIYIITSAEISVESDAGLLEVLRPEDDYLLLGIDRYVQDASIHQDNRCRRIYALGK